MVRVKLLKNAALCLAILGLTATVASSAEWLLFFEIRGGNRSYIEKESMQRTPEGTILVWEKIESVEATSGKIHVEQLREVDWAHRRFKVLQATGYHERIKTYRPSEEWKYFEPNDLDLARYDAMCGKGEKK
jgi:hypothetical protein